MSKKINLSDEEVELEIEKLRKDPDVALARAEQRMRYKRRQYLYQLRSFKKRGESIRSNPDYAWLVDAYEDQEFLKDEEHDYE
ncbi:MAG: hypothetical protein ACI4F5_06275 [Acutalibacteraceae bacterium]